MKKQGEGPPGKPPPSPCLCSSMATPSPVLRTHFQVPYPASPVFATLTKTAGVCTNNSQLATTPLLSFNFQLSTVNLLRASPRVTNHESLPLLHCCSHGSPTPRPTLSL